MTCEDLRKVSELSRSVIIESLQSSGDPELDQGLFEATLKEVEKGFLEGPVCRSSLPPGSTLTKRFPVKQKNKVRPIDDCKASLVTFAVTQNEGVTIHTIDHIASMTACCMKSCFFSDAALLKALNVGDDPQKKMVAELGQAREMLVHIRSNTKEATKDLKNCGWQMSELRSGATDQNGAATTQSGSLLYLLSEDMKTSCQAVLEAMGKSVTIIQEAMEKGVHPERSHKRKLEIAQEEEEKEQRERSMLFPVIHPFTAERMLLNQEQRNQFLLDLQKMGLSNLEKVEQLDQELQPEVSLLLEEKVVMWSPVRVTLRLRAFRWECSHPIFHQLLWHQQLYQCLVLLGLLLESDPEDCMRGDFW